MNLGKTWKTLSNKQQSCKYVLHKMGLKINFLVTKEEL